MPSLHSEIIRAILGNTHATNRDANVEKVGPDELQASSRSGSLAGYGQGVLHPGKSVMSLAGCPVILPTTFSCRHSLWADTHLGSSNPSPSGTRHRSELSTTTSASSSFGLHLTMVQRQKVEADAFPPNNFIFKMLNDLTRKGASQPSRDFLWCPYFLLSILYISILRNNHH